MDLIKENRLGFISLVIILILLLSSCTSSSKPKELYRVYTCDAGGVRGLNYAGESQPTPDQCKQILIKALRDPTQNSKIVFPDGTIAYNILQNEDDLYTACHITDTILQNELYACKCAYGIRCGYHEIYGFEEAQSILNGQIHFWTDNGFSYPFDPSIIRVQREGDK